MWKAKGEWNPKAEAWDFEIWNEATGSRVSLGPLRDRDCADTGPSLRMVNGLGDLREIARALDVELSAMLAVGLDPVYMQRYPHEFSGGQRQRIGLARTLSLQPRLIIADEPVSALDVSIQAQVLNLLQAVQQDLGLTLLFIAHDLSVVEHVSDRIAVMYVGRLVEMAETDVLLRHPLHPYTEALISAVPPADPDIRLERIVLEGDVPSPANPPPGCVFHPRCLYAQSRCREEAPQLLELRPGHYASCHFADALSLQGIGEQT